MADDGGSGGSARARGERPGRVYMGAEGRLGGRGVNHVAGARTAWAARRCDVRRRGGQWRAAVGTLASGNWPPGAVQLFAVVTHSGIPARRMDRWVRQCLGVRARTAAGMARVRDVARGCALAFPGCWYFTKRFSKLFFSNFSN
jgi:hypothetical protein